MDVSDCLAAVLNTYPAAPGICRRTPRSAFPSWAIRFELETQASSLLTMQSATDLDTVAGFVDDVLAGTGWKRRRVRARSSRLEPPDSYWSVFSVDINKEEEKRNLRLVAKGALNPAAWERLSGRLLRHGAGRSCDPVNGVGYPRLFPDTQHAYWFYPFDPTMPRLPHANDPRHMSTV